jgi:hypothetical protein
VRFNQKRQTAGKVLETATTQEPAFDPCEYKVTAADISKLESYFKDAKALKEKLQNVRKWLPKAEEGQTAETTVPEQTPQKYLDYLVARASTPPTPRVMAKKVLLDKVQTGSPVFGNSQILMTNISDSAKTAGLPVGLEMKSLDTQASVKMTVDYSSGGTPQVSGTFGGFDLSKMQSDLSGSRGLMFESGIASGTFQGHVTNESIDLTLDVNVSDMKAKAGEGGVVGLDSKTASEALAVLNNLSTKIRIVGPVTDPRLAFDVKGLESEFKNALVKAGKQKLADEVDKQIGQQVDKQLGEKAPSGVRDAVEKSTGLIKGLLGGKQDK